jgi:histidinol phosphatase-like PHP family hydrolase
MKFTYDHDLHIHSNLSPCDPRPEQTPDFILSYAKKNGLHTICLTDHYWDERVEGAADMYAKQHTAHIKKALPLPQADGIRFLFGCETEMRADMTIGISRERFDEMDFVIVPTTHLHFKDFTLKKEADGNPELLAELWIERLDALLDMDLPFRKVGIAHPVSVLMAAADKEIFRATLKALRDEDLRRIFKRIAKKGAGVEINQFDFFFDYGAEEDILRIYRIAKAEGCKFYLGSDSHLPEEFEKTTEAFEKAIALLGLTEEDKFKI